MPLGALLAPQIGPQTASILRPGPGTTRKAATSLNPISSSTAPKPNPTLPDCPTPNVRPQKDWWTVSDRQGGNEVRYDTTDALVKNFHCGLDSEKQATYHFNVGDAYRAAAVRTSAVEGARTGATAGLGIAAAGTFAAHLAGLAVLASPIGVAGAALATVTLGALALARHEADQTRTQLQHEVTVQGPVYSTLTEDGKGWAIEFWPNNDLGKTVDLGVYAQATPAPDKGQAGPLPWWRSAAE